MTIEQVRAGDVRVGDRIRWAGQVVLVVDEKSWPKKNNWRWDGREFVNHGRSGRYLICEVKTRDGEADVRQLHYYDDERVERER